MRRLLPLIVLMFMVSCLWSYDSGKRPFQAMFLSLAVPGGGQFYNESYYKAAFVFALEGFFIGRTIYHHNRMNYYYDKAEESFGDDFLYYNQRYLRYYDKRQSDFWWLGTIVFLSVVDAFVDANLYNYEMERERVRILFEDNMVGISISF